VSLDPQTLLTILLMALATYATRAGGLWLASRLTLSGRVEAWLDHIPGAILVSIVAPGNSAYAWAMIVLMAFGLLGLTAAILLPAKVERA